MDWVFLDANVLFAAAWRTTAALGRLWALDAAELEELGGVLILPPPNTRPWSQTSNLEHGRAAAPNCMQKQAGTLVTLFVL
jgi:hypothetical protein